MPAIETDLAAPANPHALFGAYAAGAGIYDEFALPDGAPRETYRRLIEALPGLDAAEMKRRNESARQIIREQGITYNVYGDPLGVERPWQFDPVPLAIGAAEWTRLEAALIQRAVLINRILADCYGQQNLIRSGRLPPALVFAQPDFLRPCHGLRPPGDVFLHLYAADLARAADGQWWVLSDRTQIPTGAGYALANRLISARILPEPFRDCNVQRLAGFFRELQATLSRLASRRTDQPRVVVLTPGPFNETYFEQAWLARYLGYALVEGQDLTTRDDRVFLKTLSGLEPVDVILRRVDDDWCDPLELRNDSMLGLPGLVGALRAGNVAVANTPGSALAQSPAFMPFLPGLCRHVLGEELKLPSIATWWCGQSAAEQYVLEHQAELVIRSAFRSHSGAEPATSNPDDARREKRLEKMRAQPELFVAQEGIKLSTAPAWDGRMLSSKPVSLRIYLVATADGYCVMPGGLTRVGTESGGGFVSMQAGGSSKDTWVIGGEPVKEVTLLSSSGQPVELRRVGNNLPSRLADNFFWLGRYAERAGATARLLRSLLTRFNLENAGGSLPMIEPLLDTLVRQGQASADFVRSAMRRPPEELEAELLAEVFDASRRGSLRGVAAELQRLAVLVRDRTSQDLWRALMQMGNLLMPDEHALARPVGGGVHLLNEALLHLAAFQGLARENMTRAQGWRFLDIGMRIERAIYLCDFLDCALRSREADNPSILETVLEIADSTLTYRSRYNLLPHIAAVYDLVLLDDTNPRSLLFQLNQLVKHFDRLPRERESALPSAGQRVLIQCLARLRLADPQPLALRHQKWHQSEVGAAITRTLSLLPKLSDAIAVSYFAHSAISRAGTK